VRKKTFDFLVFIEVQQNFIFPFSLLIHIKCLNASLLTTAVFERVQQFYHATEIGNVLQKLATGSALTLINLCRQNKCNCFG